MSFYSAQRLTPSGLRLLAREIVPTADSDAAGGPAWLMPVLTLVVAGVLATVVTLHGHEFMTAIERAAQTDWRLAAAGALFEAASIAGYVVLQHRVIGAADSAHPAEGLLRHRARRHRRHSAAADRWPRRRGGHRLGAEGPRRALRARVAERLLAFLLLIYAVYMAALLVFGAAVGFGLVHVVARSALGVARRRPGARPSALPALTLRPPRTGSPALLRRAALGSGRRASSAARARSSSCPRSLCAQRRARSRTAPAPSGAPRRAGLVGLRHRRARSRCCTRSAPRCRCPRRARLLPRHDVQPAAAARAASAAAWSARSSCFGAPAAPATRRRAGLPHDRGLAARRLRACLERPAADVGRALARRAAVAVAPPNAPERRRPKAVRRSARRAVIRTPAHLLPV